MTLIYPTFSITRLRRSPMSRAITQTLPARAISDFRSAQDVDSAPRPGQAHDLGTVE